LAANLVANDTNADRDVFLKKITGPKVLRRSSVKSDGSEVNGTSVESTSPDVTEDGAAVVFESTQTQLVPDDTNGYRDVVMRNSYDAPSAQDPPPHQFLLLKNYGT
jgi:hypothetical protein